MSEVPERIVKRKAIVYKSLVDHSKVKTAAEKIKMRLFVKRFSKPKPEEIQIVSVDKYYEPYILVDARYSVNYFKTRFFTLSVDHETEKVRIFGAHTSFKPETVVGPTGESHKVIKLEAEEFFSYEDKAYLILDKTGREIPLDQVPTAPSEDHPHKTLKEAGKKVEKVKFSPRKEIEMVRAKIVKRPPDADRIKNELFQISEHAVIYSPIYEITFQNVKTGEEKTIKIDGITAKIIY